MAGLARRRERSAGHGVARRATLTFRLDHSVGAGHEWHVAHFLDPRALVPESVMPDYPHFFDRLAFADALRPDAAAVIAALRRRGLEIELLSGDRAPVVERVAAELAIARWRAGCTPAGKCDRLAELAAAGRRVLMVGDGLNDAAAHVSLSPASAVDISQTAADAVFQGERLGPMREVLDVARRAERRVRQNFALSFGYNLLTVPIAVLGFLTPLIAAVCMSASSIVVVGNALRMGRSP